MICASYSARVVGAFGLSATAALLGLAGGSTRLSRSPAPTGSEWLVMVINIGRRMPTSNAAVKSLGQS